MKLYPFCVLFFIFLTHSVFAQNIKGKIATPTGEAIPYATLFVREMAWGMVANEEGEFQSTLSPGNYTFEFSALGYEKTIIPVKMETKNQELSVILESKIYSLQEVEVSSRREDPAYGIMRKAISMAPYYLNQIKEYDSEVYIKGTVKLDKMPRVLKWMDRDNEIEKYENKLFLLESQNQVTFNSPDRYKQHVIAFSSSIPQDMESTDALSLITANVYSPTAFDCISPLAPGAFSYYKFTLEGIVSEGDHLINKIKITPKRNNPKLVSGWIYIIENSWNVKSIDFNTTEMGVGIRFTATYNEVRPQAFLPTAYDIDIKINVAGIKATGKYYSSVQYKQVELNKQLPFPIPTQQPEKTAESEKLKPQTKAQKQLEELGSKENLTNREAYKMARLMEKEGKTEEQRKQKEELEIIYNNSRIEVTTDTLASTRDSVYWAKIRNLPLRPEEITSYQIKDSLQQELESTRKPTRGEQYGKSGNTTFDDILMGGGVNLTKKLWLGYSGIIGACPEYNFTDGFWLGQKLTVEYEFNKSRKFSLIPAVYYTTARKHINWQLEGNYKYNPKKNGLVTIRGGNTTADFNSRDGHMRILNSFSSLLFATNPIRFYQKQFIEVSHRIDIIHGLFFTTTATHEKRSPLVNHTTYSFFGGLPYPNIPEGHLPMIENRSTTLSVEVEYTPRYKYYKWGDRKVYYSSNYPTFSLFYQAGIPAGKMPDSSFQRLEGSIKQAIKLNSFNSLDYYINGGAFLSDKRITLPDYKHFATSGIVVTEKSPYTSFALPDSYLYSTSRHWLQGHLSFTSQYLLFKNLPFLQHLPVDEGLHSKTLWIPGKNYSELGYSIGVENAIRIGVFTGWDKGKYDCVGIRLNLPFLLEF